METNQPRNRMAMIDKLVSFILGYIFSRFLTINGLESNVGDSQVQIGKKKNGLEEFRRKGGKIVS